MDKLFAILLLTSAGQAATIRFTGLPGNNQYGTYNGYVTATIDGIALQDLICNDYNHTTYVPSGPIDFSQSSLTGATPLEFARFTGPNQQDAIARYEEAAILLNGLNQTGPGLLLDLTADYQYALWKLFTPSVVLPNATAQTLLNEAAAAVQQGDPGNQVLYAELQIFTPRAAYASNQEFLRLNPSGVTYSLGVNPPVALATPEPLAVVLIGLGLVLVGLGLGLRKRNFGKRRAP